MNKNEIEMRTPDGHLVGKYDASSGILKVKVKKWIAKISLAPNPSVSYTEA